MAIQFNPSNIGSGLGYASQINNLFSTLATALEDAVSRSGYGANAMSADLDLGNNDLLNVGRVNADELYVDGAQLASLAEMQQYTADAEAAQTAAETAQAAAETARDEAEAAAAGVSLPSITTGDADKLLVVKDDESGFELLADLPANSVPTAAVEDSAITTTKINDTGVTRAKLNSDVYATQAQAEAGTNSNRLMTPQRVQQWYDAKYSAAPTGFLNSGNRLFLSETGAAGVKQAISAGGAGWTVGPTGSGADETNPVLDDLPASAKAVILFIDGYITASSGSTLTEYSVYGGYPTGNNDETLIANISVLSSHVSANDVFTISQTVVVPVDSNNIMVLRRTDANTGANTVGYELVGYYE